MLQLVVMPVLLMTSSPSAWAGPADALDMLGDLAQVEWASNTASWDSSGSRLMVATMGQTMCSTTTKGYVSENGGRQTETPFRCVR
jgi:hypothetical protein